MSKWTVKASVLYILGCVVVVMLLIVVLPFVDLPDTAFHRGTAPSVVHALATNAPLAITVPTLVRVVDPIRESRPFLDAVAPDVSPDPNLRPFFLRSIRC